MRVAAIVAVVAVLALGAAGAGLAQQPPPTVTVTASETTLTVGVTGPLAAGPTRFEIVKAGGDNLEISIAALRPGITLAQFTAALRSSDPESAIDSSTSTAARASRAGP